jgi:predicted AAA+ superfamily ATPase
MQPYEVYDIHNLFKKSVEAFKAEDPHLRRIHSLPFSYLSPLATEAAFNQPGIYLLTGGRQVGKTTFVKQYILELLQKQPISPDNILFVAGELIDNHHSLIRLIENFSNPAVLQYLFIDEINYIQDWDKGIKYLADAGFFEKTVVMLTGSDSLILRTAMQRFAGRRGQAEQVDFIFYPLSFREFILLKNPALQALCDLIDQSALTEKLPLYSEHHAELMQHLNNYLIHGGYLPAIANYWQDQTIHPGTLRTYNEWIIGDMLKFKKSEKHVREILKGILSCYSTQISWNSLLKHLTIEHHHTVSDYCTLLENIHVLYILEALDQNALRGAPKKNKKIYFQDPYIYHADSGLIQGNLSLEHILANLSNPERVSELIEGIVVSHCKRYAPTFYIKGNQGEVDVALVNASGFTPIEVKWTTQLRPENLKQIQCYPNGLILWNRDYHPFFEQLPVIPLPRFLLLQIDSRLNSKSLLA